MNDEEEDLDVNFRVGYRARRGYRMWEAFENEKDEDYMDDWLEEFHRSNERVFPRAENGFAEVEEGELEEDEWNLQDIDVTDHENAEDKTEETNLLLLVAFTLLLRLSRKELGIALVLIEHFVGSPINITIEMVFGEIEKKRMDHQPTIRRLCGKCFSNTSKKNACVNSNCENNGVAPKRSKSNDPVVVTSFNIDRQIKDTISRNFEEIRTFHRRLHYDLVENDGKEFRRSQRYRELIETKAEFDNKIMTVPLSLFFDGFRLKKQTRTEYIPFYLRVESIEGKKKGLPSSSILFTMVETRGQLITEGYQAIGENLLEQLHRLETVFVADENQTQWKIQLRLSHGMADLKGIHDACSLPFWLSEYGCHKCVIKSVRRTDCAARSFKGKGAPRTEETMIQQFNNKTYNFGNKIGFNGVLLPCAFNLDLLHLLNEGVLKDWSKGILFRSSTWTQRTTSSTTIKMISSTLENIVNYTYSNSFVLTPKDFSRLTGCEIESLAYVVLRLALTLHVFTDETVHILLLGIILITENLYKKDYVEMKRIANLVGDFHDASHGLFITLKNYLIYRHLADELILNNKDAVDSADFEKLHKFLQSGIVDHNCAHQSTEMSRRFLCLRDTLDLLQNNKPISPAAEKFMTFKSGPSIRFPAAKEIAENLKVSPKWKIDNLDVSNLNPCYSGFLKQGSSVYFRALIKDQPFQSKHWSNKKTVRSQMHIVSFKKRRTCRGFGDVCLFIEQNGHGFVLIEEYSTASSINVNISKIPRHLQNLAQQIRFSSDSSDSLIVKNLNRTGLILVSTDDIISPALSFESNGHSFLCPIRFSPIIT